MAEQPILAVPQLPLAYQPLLTGNRLALARAISRVEDEAAEAQAILRGLYPHTGRAHILGITGAPGAGKSTLVTALAQSYRRVGLTVAIVAVDPTSPFTGGALLGDRVRMRALSGDPGVFVRSMATRGNLGGLSKTTSDVVTVLDAAGFERILVETVGVGQAEVEIARTAHSTVVIEAPGLGDEVQAIKAGILEIADLLVVNKADLPGVDRAVKALELMLELQHGAGRTIRHHGQLLYVEAAPVAAPTGWATTVLKTIAASGEGVEELRDQLEQHRTWLHTTGEFAQRERVRAASTVEGIVRAELNRRIQTNFPPDTLAELVEQVRQRVIDPYTAAQQLLGG
jgi:LAO/AO transport system kinase